MLFTKLLNFIIIAITATLTLNASTSEKIPLCISLGGTCKPALYLRDLGWRHEAYPFDWMVSPFSALYQALDEDFLYFLTDLRLSSTNNGVHDRYGFFFSHDWPTTIDANVENDHVGGTCLLPNWEKSTELVKKKYSRRIERLNNACLNKEKILFIRTEYVTKLQSILLKNLIECKYPKLDFVLVVIANHHEFQDPWNIEKIRNFYYNVNNDSLDDIRSMLISVIKDIK